jgi:hypothetical protein
MTDHHIADRERRKRQAAADGFVVDASLERLIADAKTGTPPVLAPELRMRLGYYQRAKAAHYEITTGKKETS